MGGCGGVFVSNDDGISWAPINEGLPFPCVEHLATLAKLPFEGLAMDPRLQAPPVPGLFSGAGANGQLAIQNFDGSPNSVSNPALRGSTRLTSQVSGST